MGGLAQILAAFALVQTEPGAPAPPPAAPAAETQPRSAPPSPGPSPPQSGGEGVVGTPSPRLSPPPSGVEGAKPQGATGATGTQAAPAAPSPLPSPPPSGGEGAKPQGATGATGTQAAPAAPSPQPSLPQSGGEGGERAPEGERTQVARAALRFLDALVAGDADGLAAASAERFSFDGQVETGLEAIVRTWRGHLDRRSGPPDALLDLDVRPALDAVARYGPPPARVAPLARPGTWVAVANVSGRAVVLFLSRSGGGWTVAGMHD